MNTNVIYFYRDGLNYKSRPISVVFAGSPEPDLVARLKAALDNDTFVAEQVDLPTCYLFHESYDFDRTSDHGRHELSLVESTTAQPTDDGFRTFQQLVEEFEAAQKAGWAPLSDDELCGETVSEDK